MEPENKREIQLGWWKFLGLQAVSVLIICLIMTLFHFYPVALKGNYQVLKKNYKNYRVKTMDATRKVEQMAGFLNKYKDQGKLSQGQSDSLKSLCTEINNSLLNAEKKKPYHFFPNYYQELANRYIALDESFKQASSGNCANELLMVKQDRDRLENLKNDLSEKFDKYRSEHP